jgi:hypothetical protein
MANGLKRSTVVVLVAIGLSACGGGGGGQSPMPGVGASSFDLSNAVALMQLCLEAPAFFFGDAPLGPLATFRTPGCFLQ